MVEPLSQLFREEQKAKGEEQRSDRHEQPGRQRGDSLVRRPGEGKQEPASSAFPGVSLGTNEGQSGGCELVDHGAGGPQWDSSGKRHPQSSSVFRHCLGER